MSEEKAEYKTNNEEPSVADTFLVGVDFSHGKDVGVLIVGKQRPDMSAQIINAFRGEEAYELYQKLITKR